MPPSSTPSESQNLPATVLQTIVDYQLLAAGDHVLVGVSGGPDSMVLLHLLDHLAPALKIKLGVAHLNHCLRGAHADRDAQTVRRAASRLGIPCHVGKAHVARVKRGLNLSLEDAARRVRYAFFLKIMQAAGYNKLALGHHLNDNAEQMLMVLLRGAGPKGLSGIAPIRQNRFIRPLIRVRRSQIEAYAKTKGIFYVTDASNQDPRFLRNRIRHHLLPLLACAYNPRIEDQLSQLADVMRMEDEWIDNLITPLYANAIVDQKEGRLALSIGALQHMHPALVRRLLRRALLEAGGSLRRIGFAHIQSVQRLIMKGLDGKSVHLPRGIRVRRNADQLEMSLAKNYRRRGNRPNADRPPAARTVIRRPFPCTVEVEALGIGMRFVACRPDELPRWPEVGPNQAFFDLERLSLPLILRSTLPGDRFTPLGCGGSQKVKKYFIDHHIRREDRAMMPILADQRQIIWLVGQRIDDRPKVTPATTTVLCTEFFLLDTQ
jgi:tRNA(Ile)-lysidine synthase